MKTYIVTYYQYDNYGTRLQNFALKRNLEKFNTNVETLYIKDTKDFIKEKIKFIISYFPSVTSKQKLWKSNRIKRKKFKKFNKELNFYKLRFNKLKNIDQIDSKFIVGSDQVWSPNHLSTVENAKDLYLLNFVKNAKCFTYAPSFGVSKITKAQKQIYKYGLKKFESLTIREEAGKKILEELNYKDTKILPDPVFLLKKEEWLENIKNIKKRTKKRYILTYFLGKKDEKRDNEINKIAAKYNYDTINICGNYFKSNDLIATPENFLYLINNAEIIFTDSFHATAFSIIFNKMFYVIKRNDVKQFSRLETLLGKYGLYSRIINDKNSLSKLECKEYDYAKVNKILKKEREIGINYLINISK